MKNNEVLRNHPLYLLLLEHSKQYLSENKFSVFDIELHEALDEHQYYIHRVGFYYSYLMKWVEQLFLSSELLKNFDYVKDSTYTRFDHLYYNYENYIIRYQSSNDRVLQLINSIFHLCNPDNNVNEKNVICNEFVTHYGIDKVYNSMSCLKVYRKERNEIVHKHSLLTKQLKKLEVFYAENNLGNIQKKYRTEILRKEVLKTGNIINSNNDKLVLDIVKLLDNLIGVYKMIEKRILLTTAST